MVHLARRLALLSFSIVGLLGCVSCAGRPGLVAGSRAQVSVAQTDVFFHGPAQFDPANTRLLRGQVVTVLAQSHGYSEVQTLTGMIGHVRTRDLKPAVESLVPEAPGRLVRRSEVEPQLPEAASGESLDLAAPSEILPVDLPKVLSSQASAGSH